MSLNEVIPMSDFNHNNPVQPMIPGLPTAADLMRLRERELQAQAEAETFDLKYMTPSFAAKAMGLKLSQLRNLIEQKRLPEGAVHVSLALRRTGLDVTFVEGVAQLEESERRKLPWWPLTREELKQLRVNRYEWQHNLEAKAVRIERKRELVKIAFEISIANLTLQSLCAEFTWEPLHLNSPNGGYHIMTQFWHDLVRLGVDMQSITEVRLLGPSEFRKCPSHNKFPVTQYYSLCDLLRDQLELRLFGGIESSFEMLTFAKQLCALNQALGGEIALNMVEQLMANQLALLRNEPLDTDKHATLQEQVGDIEAVILSKKTIVDELIMFASMNQQADKDNEDFPLSRLIHEKLRETYPLTCDVMWGTQ